MHVKKVLEQRSVPIEVSDEVPGKEVFLDLNQTLESN